jgi:hypothetical protein
MPTLLGFFRKQLPGVLTVEEGFDFNSVHLPTSLPSAGKWLMPSQSSLPHFFKDYKFLLIFFF